MQSIWSYRVGQATNIAFKRKSESRESFHPLLVSGISTIKKDNALPKGLEQKETNLLAKQDGLIQLRPLVVAGITDRRWLPEVESELDKETYHEPVICELNDNASRVPKFPSESSEVTPCDTSGVVIPSELAIDPMPSELATDTVPSELATDPIPSMLATDTIPSEQRSNSENRIAASTNTSIAQLLIDSQAKLFYQQHIEHEVLKQQLAQLQSQVTSLSSVITLTPAPVMVASEVISSQAAPSTFVPTQTIPIKRSSQTTAGVYLDEKKPQQVDLQTQEDHVESKMQFSSELQTKTSPLELKFFESRRVRSSHPQTSQTRSFSKKNVVSKIFFVAPRHFGLFIYTFVSVPKLSKKF